TSSHRDQTPLQCGAIVDPSLSVQTYLDLHRLSAGKTQRLQSTDRLCRNKTPLQCGVIVDPWTLPQHHRKLLARPRRHPEETPKRRGILSVKRSKPSTSARSDPQRGRQTCGERPTDARFATTAGKPTTSTVAAPTVDLGCVVFTRTTHARGTANALATSRSTSDARPPQCHLSDVNLAPHRHGVQRPQRADPAERDSLLLGNVAVLLEQVGRRTVFESVFQLPSYVPGEALQAVLGPYGKILGVSHPMYKGRPTLYTMNEGCPHRNEGGSQLHQRRWKPRYVRVSGERVWTHCVQKGHFGSACRAPRCSRCEVFGHCTDGCTSPSNSCGHDQATTY
ncbi:hypothetical protein HPB47_001575, partial [Ixodes persulcatus]